MINHLSSMRLWEHLFCGIFKKILYLAMGIRSKRKKDPERSTVFSRQNRLVFNGTGALRYNTLDNF
jgi:hypothetical protein